VKYHDIFLQQFLVIVFFMVLPVANTGKPIPELAFRGSLTIEWSDLHWQAMSGTGWQRQALYRL